MTRFVFKTRDEWVPQAGANFLNSLFLKESKFSGIDKFQVKSLFSSLNKAMLDSLCDRAVAMDTDFEPVNFSSYHILECQEHKNKTELLNNLRNNEFVSWAYEENNDSIGPNIHPDKKPVACFQGYLYNAPEGIGASHAWRKKGGRGDSSINFVDIEQGWLFDHESLNLQRIPYSGINYEEASDHGAGVMGIIMMRDGGSGGIGITPLVKGSVLSLYRPDRNFNTPDAIVSALHFLDAGDILLLESQALDPDNEFQFLPLEILQANFDVIRMATALGITVIEPAGNGNINASRGNSLDHYKNLNGENILDPRHRAFKDSGAIIVAAATSTVPHQRMHFSNYGRRVNCYAWGENILTAGRHPQSSGAANNTYTRNFGGTSGAAAIIAGAAISLQSMMEANHHCRLNPGQIREILSSISLGTESAKGDADEGIGIMPDLEKIVNNFVDKFGGHAELIPRNGYLDNHLHPVMQA